MNNRKLHQSERDFAKQNAKKFAQYHEEKTGQIIDDKRAEQILLGDGYRMVDAAANKGHGVVGPADDAVAVSFIAQNAGHLFKATPAEYNNPGKLGGPLTPEQAALPGARGNPALGLGTAAVITGCLAVPALFAISGTPVFSSAGALGSGMWASPARTAAISAGINAGAQYCQNRAINSVGVAVAAVTGGAGAHGGLLWKISVNAAGGAGGFSYGTGSLVSSGFKSVLRPTINSSNWAGAGIWRSSSGINLFLPNRGL